MTAPFTANDLGWLIDSFTRDTPGVVAGVVVSVDGLLVSRSTNLDDTTAGHIAALAAGVASMANGGADLLPANAGTADRVVIKYDRGYVLIRTINASALFVAVANASSDLSMIAREIGSVTGRVGASLSPALIMEAHRTIASWAGVT